MNEYVWKTIYEKIRHPVRIAENPRHKASRLFTRKKVDRQISHRGKDIFFHVPYRRRHNLGHKCSLEQPHSLLHDLGQHHDPDEQQKRECILARNAKLL